MGHHDSMQFQIAMLQTNRYKQFLKLWGGSSRGPALPGRAVEMQGYVILIASKQAPIFSKFYNCHIYSKHLNKAFGKTNMIC